VSTCVHFVKEVDGVRETAWALGGSDRFIT
jgi:hypothetical protein